MRKHYTFDEAFELDNIIKKLALYEVSGGKMFISDNYEELMDLQVECAHKFNYFKGLIQSGECTIEYLKDTVLSKNGPYPQHTELIETPEHLMEYIDEEDKRKVEEQDFIESLYSNVETLLKEKDFEVYSVTPETTTTTTTKIIKIKKKKTKNKKDLEQEQNNDANKSKNKSSKRKTKPKSKKSNGKNGKNDKHS